MDPELETVSRGQQGDREALASLLASAVPVLRSLVRRLGSHHEAEDQLQDLLAQVATTLPRFRPDGPARWRTWMFTVAHRFLLMQRRRPRLTLVDLAQAEAVEDPAPDAEQVTSDQQLRLRLEAALAELPEAQRRVFVLAEIHRLDHKEVARLEDVPVGTVKSRLHRARAQLVSSLGEVLDAPEKGAIRAHTR